MNIIFKIRQECVAHLDALLAHLPGRLGVHLRFLTYRRRFGSCGGHITIAPLVSIKGWRNIHLGANICIGELSSLYAESQTHASHIVIGNNVSFNRNVMINADVNGSIVIADNVLVGPNVVMRASGHRYDKMEIPIRNQGHHSGKIEIHTDVWIGANAVILPDVVIGQGAVVAAGAVVVKSVAALDIVGGVPARKISSRRDDRKSDPFGFRQ